MNTTTARDMTTDDVYPRDAENRYRIYALLGLGDLVILATAPDAGGVGQAILTLHEDQRNAGGTLGDLGRLGVLDTMPEGKPSRSGEWIVCPFDRAASPPLAAR